MANAVLVGSVFSATPYCVTSVWRGRGVVEGKPRNANEEAVWNRRVLNAISVHRRWWCPEPSNAQSVKPNKNHRQAEEIGSLETWWQNWLVNQ